MIRLACLRALALLVCCVPLAARAQYYNYFSPGPAGQVEKSDGSPALAAAAATDVAALFTGCSASAPALGYLGGCVAVGAGTVTSVAFSDDSTAPLYAVSGSPCSVTCAIVITLETQAANCVIAGPSSGAPAQPACRALVTADLPPSGVTAASYTNANVTVDATGRITAASNGSSSGCVFAAPSAAVALTAVTGTSGDCMDAGSAPALSQAISPTWTGTHTFSVAPVFSAGADLANAESLSAEDSNGTLRSVFTALDASNNSLWTNVADGDLLLEVAPSAGGTPVPGLAVIPENSTYSQTEVYDAAGNAQNAGYLGCPENSESTTYTLQLSDRGKCISPRASFTITVPASTFSTGDTVTIVSCCGFGNTTISAPGGVTIYWANGTGGTGTRTINDGIATLWFFSSSMVIITGSGIS